MIHTRTVKLSDGSVTICGDFNYFALTHEERELLRKICELMDFFEKFQGLTNKTPK